MQQQRAFQEKKAAKEREKVQAALTKQTELKTQFTGRIRRRYGGEGALARKKAALQNVKEIETEPTKMKTYPRIPFERAIKLRPRASPMEAERYFLLSFEQDLDDWLKPGIKAPAVEDLMGALNDTTLKKLDCMQATSACRGMNRKVYSGEFENCGKLAPFYIWKRYIDDKEFEEDVGLF